ncbi:MAG: aldo/keto reductase [Lysobacterales bacterium]
MQYRHLGRTGIRVSELSLGSWVTFENQVDVNAACEMMAAAHDAGVNFFDNAEVYAHGESERVMGEAIKRLKWRRGSYLVSTKLYWGLQNGVNESNTLNRKYLLEAIGGSLKRLQLDHVDVLFCHRPDKSTPIEETVWAMHNIIERGQALYWGTSEWDADEIVAAIEIANRHHLHAPVVEQPQYNLLERRRFEHDYARLFSDYGYGSTTWSPLASGMLTGKYLGGIPEGSRGHVSGYEWLRDRLTDRESLARVEKLQPLAEELGCTLAQFSLAWLLQNPNVSTVITGASRLEQLEENLAAIDVAARFDADLMQRIDGIFGIGN